MNETEDSKEQPVGRWRITGPGVIVWNVANDPQVPHEDHLEMSGQRVSAIIRYGVDEKGNLVLRRRVVWPALRTIPNNTHASLMHVYEEANLLHLRVNGQDVTERPARFRFDGILTVESDCDGLHITRHLLPSMDRAGLVERLVVSNTSTRTLTLSMEDASHTVTRRGAYGIYLLETRVDRTGRITLEPGDEIQVAVSYTGRRVIEPPVLLDAEEEEAKRRAFVRRMLRALQFECPDPALQNMFALSKIRAAESVFLTRGGLMHGPGGGSYYAAVWTNDQVEYAGPFFPFLGDPVANEASLSAYRLYQPFMGPEYDPIPTSIIAEGMDIWEGAGDRGDAAMYAYGAARFALAMGDRRIAEDLWPAIAWCLEYCRRKMTPEGVIASDSDELEGRFPSGNANLSTASLAYGGFRSAADLALCLGRKEEATSYTRQADALHTAIEAHFGASVEGFHTYRYFEGNTVLRSWIGLPLTMGINDRVEGTLQALFSPRLWTEDGLATQAGDVTFWDRSTLYGLRAAFYAGATALALRYFLAYSYRRLLGDHVPYAVEAYPEGNQRHLSAESALYCRVVTEGLFGLRPVGLAELELKPRLPEEWPSMELRSVSAFGRDFDIHVERQGESLRVDVTERIGDVEKEQTVIVKSGETVVVNFN